MKVERKLERFGTQMEREWNANGTQMEREWNANGTRMEREWNANGTHLRTRSGRVPNAFSVRLFLSSTVWCYSSPFSHLSKHIFERVVANVTSVIPDLMNFWIEIRRALAFWPLE